MEVVVRQYALSIGLGDPAREQVAVMKLRDTCVRMLAELERDESRQHPPPRPALPPPAPRGSTPRAQRYVIGAPPIESPQHPPIPAPATYVVVAPMHLGIAGTYTIVQGMQEVENLVWVSDGGKALHSVAGVWSVGRGRVESAEAHLGALPHMVHAWVEVRDGTALHVEGVHFAACLEGEVSPVRDLGFRSASASGSAVRAASSRYTSPPRNDRRVSPLEADRTPSVSSLDPAALLLELQRERSRNAHLEESLEKSKQQQVLSLMFPPLCNET